MAATTVLIAEDNPGFRAGVRLLIGGSKDFEIVGEASNGSEAVKLAGELRPDLVVMDIELPEVNGLDATRRLRADLVTTKVVIVSARDPSEAQAAADECGAACFVPKLAVVPQLLPTMRAVVGLGRA